MFLMFCIFRSWIKLSRHLCTTVIYLKQLSSFKYNVAVLYISRTLWIAKSVCQSTSDLQQYSVKSEFNLQVLQYHSSVIWKTILHVFNTQFQTMCQFCVNPSSRLCDISTVLHYTSIHMWNNPSYKSSSIMLHSVLQ